MRDSDATLDRIYNMPSVFLIEVKLSHDEYIKASKGKVQKGKGKGTDSKGPTKNCRQPCSDYWRPDGCNLGHNCPKYHPPSTT